MKVYHGTVDSYIDQIKAKGIMPMPANQFDILFPNTGVMEKNRVDSEVHITTDLSTAMDYANFRADYLVAPIGQSIRFGNGPFGSRSTPVKLGGPVLSKKPTPVVLEIDLPKYWEVQEDIGDHMGIVSVNPIPPQYIKAIIPAKELKDKYDPEVAFLKDLFG